MQLIFFNRGIKFGNIEFSRSTLAFVRNNFERINSSNGFLHWLKLAKLLTFAIMPLRSSLLAIPVSVYFINWFLVLC